MPQIHDLLDFHDIKIHHQSRFRLMKQTRKPTGFCSCPGEGHLQVKTNIRSIGGHYFNWSVYKNIIKIVTKYLAQIRYDTMSQQNFKLTKSRDKNIAFQWMQFSQLFPSNALITRAVTIIANVTSET